MRYDPFSARNLVRVVSLTGLVVMMTEAVPGPACLAIGLVCLLSSATLSLFAGGDKPVKGRRRPSAIQVARPRAWQATAPEPARWQPPGREPRKSAGEPHPAIFATVAGRTTGLASSRRRD